MNKHIISAVFIVGGSGVIQAWRQGRAITPVILGTYVFLFVLSVLDLFGGRVSQLSGAIALLAALYAVLNTVDWQWIIGLVQGKKA